MLLSFLMRENPLNKISAMLENESTLKHQSFLLVIFKEPLDFFLLGRVTPMLWVGEHLDHL